MSNARETERRASTKLLSSKRPRAGRFIYFSAPMTQHALLEMNVHDVAIGEMLDDRIWAEFREMPGLSLTTRQARRLFNLPEPDCSRTLDALVKRGLLRRCVDGQYRLAVVRP